MKLADPRKHKKGIAHIEEVWLKEFENEPLVDQTKRSMIEMMKRQFRGTRSQCAHGGARDRASGRLPSAVAPRE